MNGTITKQELVELMEQIYEEEPCLHFQEYVRLMDDFFPFFQAEQVWCWKNIEVPVDDASAWIRERLDELPWRKGQGIGLALLYVWISPAHSLAVPERLMGELSSEVGHLLFDVFLQKDSEKSKLGLLLLVSMDTQLALEKTPPLPAAALPLSLGWDQSGQAVMGYMEELRHLLIAGGANTGIGAYTGALLQSLLRRDSAQELQLILITFPDGDLLRYADDPHLLLPTITDSQTAIRTLQETVSKLKQRCRAFFASGVRDIQAYNALTDTRKMPAVLVVVEELAKLMEAGAEEAEHAICQIAQLGLVAGVHLILATERPGAAGITGFVKLYVPSRIAFAVDSAMESRIIIDTSGAEHLGEEDMLYRPFGSGKPVQLQSIQALEIS